MNICGLALILLTPLAFGAEIGTGSGVGKTVSIEATIYSDSDDIKALLGAELEDGVAVAEVTVTPRGEEPVELWRSDFFLRSEKDGQRSEPYDPSQLAGSSVLVLGLTQDGGVAVAQGNGPVWGDPRSPTRLPGSGGGVGSAPAHDERRTAKLETQTEPEDELLQLLRDRVLAEEKIAGPTTGLLYFVLDGNHKTKKLWLHYRGNEEKIDIQFRPRKK